MRQWLQWPAKNGMLVFVLMLVLVLVVGR